MRSPLPGESLLNKTDFTLPLSALPQISPRERYTWVIRSRLDIAWMLPLPPLSRFSPSRVYAGHNFFPLADQFLLMPRRFAQTVFGAVSLCYDCKTLQAQRESMVPAQTESLLRVALRRDTVPFGYYEFPVVIVRNNEGGVCDVLHPHKIACEMLRASGLMGPLTTTGDGGGGKPLDTFLCMNMMNRWHRKACVEMFPPLEYGSSGSDAAVRGDEERSYLVGGSREGYVVRGVDDGGRDEEKQRQRGTTAGGRGETLIGEAGTSPATATDDAHIVSFEEATGLDKGVRRDLRSLLGTMRVHTTPRQDRRNYFLAHHYPFHQRTQTNPQQRERGLLDQIAIIEGYRLSETDLNRLALAFSCLLSDTADTADTAAAAGRDEEDEETEEEGDTLATGPRRKGEEGGGREARVADSSEERDTLLVLKTTAAEEEDLQAIVDCSLVESLHDVWASLLDNKFEPSETVCRGPAWPCLKRAMEESNSTVL